MKRTELRRSPMPSRRTPLSSRSTLARKPLAAVSAKRQQQNRVRVITERALGRNGLYGECARCRTFTYVNGHERLGRAQGGDPARPDCLLCPACNGWCEDHPQLAAWTGWKISSKHPHDHTLENGWARDLFGDIVIFADLGEQATA